MEIDGCNKMQEKREKVYEEERGCGVTCSQGWRNAYYGK